ncbi:MAG: glycoside hydrolase family 127 protein, partial [Planctomycetota bacterium]|nr:glycoside hydrolase family 127 protein [Planctomycetota bacterium]
MTRFLAILAACLCLLHPHAASGQTTLTDEFWAPRLRLNREVTLPHVLDQLEKTGRLANFEVAAGKHAGGMVGYFFNDSDVYKTLEGAAYILAASPDPAMEARCDAIIELIASAQEKDGYLYTSRQIMDPKNLPPGGKERWSDMGAGHELYCAGHLYEAAVAYAKATGKRRLLEVAIKNADLVVSVFGPGKNPHPCGHPEVEIGLAKLFDATGNAKYLQLLEFFILARGNGKERGLYGEYAQDHLPVLEQKEAVGHSVRLAYLYSGVVDLAFRTGKQEYTNAAARIWDDIVTRKLYITGGIGSQGNNEGFGAAYDLPNSSAYNETCAAIAFFNWSQRMFLATREAKYIDVAERTLYNAMLAGWSLSGDKFFYPNPLESAHGGMRRPWFDCACCPPNVVRFIASLPEHVFARFDRDLYVNHLISSSGQFTIGGTDVTVTQQSGLPWEGWVAVTVTPARPVRMTLHVRIPGWATGTPVPGTLYRDAGAARAAAVVVTGPDGAPIEVRDGYATIEREWKAGDVVRFTLPMDVRPIAADARVASDVSRLALQRGPLVYCLEAADQAQPHVRSLVAAADAPWQAVKAPKELGGVVKLTAPAGLVQRGNDGAPTITGSATATAIPYYAWANRERGGMCVWTATQPSAAKPLPAATLAHEAKASSSFGGEVAALSDQLEPASSGDHDNVFLHWWPRKGTREWVQYEFAKPTLVSSCEVYWFDDTGRGECRLPASWRIEARIDGQWQEVKNPSSYGVKGDTYNTCTFTPIETTALRLSVQSQEGWAGGIHEWRVSSAPVNASAPVKTSTVDAKPTEQFVPAAAPAAESLLPNGYSEQLN